RHASLERAEARWSSYRSDILAASADEWSAPEALARAPIEHRGWEWRHLDARARSWLLEYADADVTGLAVDDDRGVLYGIQGGRLVAWDLATGESLDVEAPDVEVFQVANRVRARRLVCTTTDGRIGIIHLDDVSRVQWMEAASDDVWRWPSMSDDGTVVCALRNRTFQAWNVETGQRIGPVQHVDAGVVHARLSHNGTRVAICRPGRVQVVTLGTGEVTGLQVNGVVHAVFSPDDTQVAAGTEWREVKVFDLATTTEIATFRGHSDQVVAVEYLADGTILSRGYSGEMFQWRVDRDRPTWWAKGDDAPVKWPWRQRWVQRLERPQSFVVATDHRIVTLEG
ncbi:MAG: hypothetical protein KDA28_05475, partial [Phycisphaerales bacterium]|nr:hypothetical protein [Phycisphaerales bacterium]